LEFSVTELITLYMSSILPLFYLLPLKATNGATFIQSDPLQIAADISVVVLAVISVLLLLAMLVTFNQIRKTLSEFQNEIKPITDRIRMAAENVEHISTVVREEVQKVHSSLTGLSGRLQESSQRMEDKIGEFNDLVDMIQNEAKSVFLNTAAAVQGVRAGAKTIKESLTSQLRDEDPEYDSKTNEDVIKADDEST